jgi:hydrogenase maturation protein HypF
MKMTKTVKAAILKIEGIVQGVGFRPTVYRLAKKHNLKGEVANEGSGVFISIEGKEENLKAFYEDITLNPPPLAHITNVSQEDSSVKNFKEFSIIKSSDSKNLKKSVLISPDISVCNDCLSEMFDSKDRRFGFPFINCTNCGPRYTIIENIPYDRPFTSMKHFQMCEMCLSEYEDPEDRRFHAQPNACPVCGPKLKLLDKDKNIIKTDNYIKKTIELLKNGNIVAIKGLGGFHLAADAQNDEAASRLRKKKNREEKPFAIMSYDIEKIEKYAHITTKEAEIINSLKRPVVLLEKKSNNSISKFVSPRNKYFGVMLPYTPLHYLLLKNSFLALIMTSGNQNSQPIITDNEDAFENLNKIADYFLIHNRDIHIGCDDSILKQAKADTEATTEESVILIRRARGFVPTPIFLKKNIVNTMGCGGELKNTICITRGDKAFLSQHIGDLENLDSYNFFKKVISHFKHILSVEPELIAFDMHPEYLSSKYALEEKNIEKVAVQHHHAHIVSCMAENKQTDPVIGISLDGAGYGTDGKIWGGEVLIAELHKFERYAHLSYTPMPGGAVAIKEPWRMGVSFLYNTFKEEFWNLDIPLFKNIDKNHIKLALDMMLKNVNSPYTSSMGRFFDAVASIISVRNKVSFEGQAAMELEMIAKHEAEDTYDFEYFNDEILFQPIIKGIVLDLQKKIEPSFISAKFHATIIKIFSELSEKIRKETGINKTALSGGVFQNSILLSGFSKALKRKDFEVFTQNLVPANDGGLSLGQAIAASEMMAS